MWFKLGLIFLSLWVVHVTGLLPLGPLGHLLLLAGLVTMLLAFVSDRKNDDPQFPLR